MRLIGRLILVPFALLLSITAGLVVLLAAAMLDPVMAALTGEVLFAGLWALVDAVSSVDDPAPVMEGAVTGLARLALAFLIAPPAFVALVSEVAGLRGWLWHVAATGLLTAAMPWLLRGSAGAASSGELHVAVVLGLTGAAAGLVYWMIAGRTAGSPAGAPLSAPLSRGS